MSFPFISHKDKQLVCSSLVVFTNKTRYQYQSLLPLDPAEHHLPATPIFPPLSSTLKTNTVLPQVVKIQDKRQMITPAICSLQDFILVSESIWEHTVTRTCRNFSSLELKPLDFNGLALSWHCCKRNSTPIVPQATHSNYYSFTSFLCNLFFFNNYRSLGISQQIYNG